MVKRQEQVQKQKPKRKDDNGEDDAAALRKAIRDAKDARDKKK